VTPQRDDIAGGRRRRPRGKVVVGSLAVGKERRTERVSAGGKRKGVGWVDLAVEGERRRWRLGSGDGARRKRGRVRRDRKKREIRVRVLLKDN